MSAPSGGPPSPHAAAPVRARFLALARRPDAEVPLAEAALLIAQEEYPDLSVARYLGELDRMAAGARAAVLAEAPAGTRAGIEVLGAYLFRDLGFRGNRDEYEDPRNSFLNDVIDRRLGIPITLSLVYCEVARRAGLEPAPVGVGFPGHFLVKYEVAGEVDPLVIDPFNGGRIVTVETLVATLAHSKIDLRPDLLRAARPREVLVRMLRNLKEIYRKGDDLRRLASILDRLVAIEPEAREHRLERGMVRARSGEPGLALADLVRYRLGLPDDSPERGPLGQVVQTLRRHRASLS